MDFIVSHGDEVNELNLKFSKLFNQAGTHGGENLQLVFMGVIMWMFFKQTNAPINEKKQLIKNLLEKV